MPDKKDTIEVEVNNELGMHARAAGSFVRIAEKFGSEINVSHGDITVNGKSIMGIMMLAAPKGSKLVIAADGHDCLEALTALGELVENRFGEEK